MQHSSYGTRCQLFCLDLVLNGIQVENSCWKNCKYIKVY